MLYWDGTQFFRIDKDQRQSAHWQRCRHAWRDKAIAAWAACACSIVDVVLVVFICLFSSVAGSGLSVRVLRIVPAHMRVRKHYLQIICLQ